MDSQFVHSLLDNLFYLVALTSISHLVYSFNWKKATDIHVKILVMSFVGIYLMAFPYNVKDGIFFDARSILVSVIAALDGLMVSAIITAILIVVRIMMGGDGVIAGVMILISSFTIGFLWTRSRILSRYRNNWYYYFALGVAVHVAMMLDMLLLPSEGALMIISMYGIPMLLTHPIVTVIFGKILIFQKNEVENRRSLVKAKKRLAQLFDYSPIGLAEVTSDFLICDVNQNFLLQSGFTKEMIIGQRFSDFFKSSNKSEQSIFDSETNEFDSLIFEVQAEFANTQIEWISVVISRIEKTKTDKSEIGDLVVSIQDITDRKRSEIAQQYLIYHDQLTGALNLTYLSQNIDAWNNSSSCPSVVVCLDINNLRMINDAFGFGTGDEVLKRVYEIISQSSPVNSEIIRWKSSEFLICLCSKTSGPQQLCIDTLNKALNELKYNDIDVSVSFGYCFRTEDSENFSEMIRVAEENMNQNKLLLMDQSSKETINIIMQSLFAKNDREMAHSMRVSQLCESIARKMKLDKLSQEKARIAGMMHDIGKIGVPDYVLNKPGPLNPSEMQIVKEHPLIGYRILSESNEFSNISEIILAHHERWDGKGYPRGISGEKISIFARIIAVADTFDAMISERPYRNPFSKVDALVEINKMSGTQFDPEVIKVFTSVIFENEPELFMQFP